MEYNSIEVMEIFDTYETKLAKAITGLKNSFAEIRAGRANPHILDKILVDYYGTPTPINQMGTVVVAEARVLVINVWDNNALKNVEKAIIAANIGLTPNNDGKVIRISIPPLTEQRRKDLVKSAKAIAEQSRVAIRNIRRDSLEELKKESASEKIAEDTVKKEEEELQKLTDSYIVQVAKVLEEKEKEIMEV